MAIEPCERGIEDIDIHALARAVFLAGLPGMALRTVEQIIGEAEELLQTAKFGLEDMRKPARRRSGLRNAVVFGRNTTWALQNLRGVVPDFDEWYGPKQEAMRTDLLMRFFHDLRTQIEKQASTPTAGRTHIESFSGTDMKRFHPSPPGAVGFFIGDASGAAGWEVRKPDGSKEKYYIDLPSDIAQVDMALPGAPGGDKLSAPELVAKYLEKIEQIVAEARQRFTQSR